MTIKEMFTSIKEQIIAKKKIIVIVIAISIALALVAIGTPK